MSAQLGDVKVGDVLYTAPHRRQLRDGTWVGPDTPDEWTVVKIGRKWITAVPDRFVDATPAAYPTYAAAQFGIADGRQNSQIGSPGYAYTPEQWEAREVLAAARKRWQAHRFDRSALGGDPTRGMTTQEAAALYNELSDVVERHLAAAGVPTQEAQRG